MEHVCRMVSAGVPSSGLGLEDGHVPTFWLLLYLRRPNKKHPRAPTRKCGPQYYKLSHKRCLSLRAGGVSYKGEVITQNKGLYPKTKGLCVTVLDFGGLGLSFTSGAWSLKADVSKALAHEILAALVFLQNSQTSGRIQQKLDPPWGARIYTIGASESGSLGVRLFGSSRGSGFWNPPMNPKGRRRA